MPKLGIPLDADTVPDMVFVDMKVTVLALPAMEVTVLDMVSGRDSLMPKIGEPFDTDTVPVMVLEDMVVTVLALPAIEDTVLDTVSGRDQLMPKLGVPLDTYGLGHGIWKRSTDAWYERSYGGYGGY